MCYLNASRAPATVSRHFRSKSTMDEDADFILGDSDSDVECISIAASDSDSDDELLVKVKSEDLTSQDPESSGVAALAAAEGNLIAGTLGEVPDLPSTGCKESYRFQSFHTLTRAAPRSVPIWIDSEHLHDKWKDIIRTHAIDVLNAAAPGIHLHLVTDKDKAVIQIYNATDDPKFKKKPASSSQAIKKQAGRAYTKGKIQTHPVVRIFFGDRKGGQRRTSIHEIIHALGFKHEHKRKGADKELKIVNPDKSDNRQFIPEDSIHGLTRFDPFSIMLYTVGGKDLKCRSHGDRVWQHVKSGVKNMEISELDKIGLNLLHPPREHSGYKPKWNPATNMFYCSRKVMATHNRPDGPISDGFCGGDPSKAVKEGPNCPACRTLKSPDGATLPLDNSRWQGWSGMIYCGKNGCGPDFRQPCQECRKLLYPGQ